MVSCNGYSGEGCSCGGRYSAALSTAFPSGFSAVAPPPRPRRRYEVLPVGLALPRCGPGDAVGVQALGALGCLDGAWPLDAAGVAQPGVGQTGVVARASGTAPLPCLERRFRVVPGHQGGAVLVPEVHARRVVEEDVQVRTCLSGRLHRLLRKMHGAVGVGEGARPLAPRRRGQHHVRQLGGLGQEQILDDGEQPFLAEDGADTGEFGQGDRRVGAADAQHPQAALLGVAEHLQGMGRRGVVRARPRFHVPDPGEVGDVLVVLPVPEARQVAKWRRTRGCSAWWAGRSCKTPAPGRPSMPRSRCRLLACTAAAVAWWDW